MFVGLMKIMLKTLTFIEKNRYFTSNLECCMKTCFKYCSIILLVMAVMDIGAQTNPNNQAIVTIIGDPVQSNNTNDFINTNPYAENTAPPAQQKIDQSNQTIEPTLDNGFHVRFEVGTDQYINHGGTTSYLSYASSSGAGYGKTKKHSVSMTERSFNAKKRIKSWLPTHKKKYRPHLCGRF